MGNHPTDGDADQRAKPVAGFYRPSTAAADRIEGLKATLYVYAKTRRGIRYPPEGATRMDQGVDLDLETDEA